MPVTVYIRLPGVEVVTRGSGISRLLFPPDLRQWGERARRGPAPAPCPFLPRCVHSGQVCQVCAEQTGGAAHSEAPLPLRGPTGHGEGERQGLEWEASASAPPDEEACERRAPGGGSRQAQGVAGPEVPAPVAAAASRKAQGTDCAPRQREEGRCPPLGLPGRAWRLPVVRPERSHMGFGPGAGLPRVEGGF